MIILSIDPGNQKMGLCSINVSDSKMELKNTYFLANPKQDMPFNQYLNESIWKFCDRFPRILDEVRPDIVIAEIIPVGRLGSNSELNVAAITTCKVISWQWGIEWREIAANSVKKIITDDGRATKAMVKKKVIAEFPIIKIFSERYKEEQNKEGIKVSGYPQDVYDAAAIGWAGAIIYGGIEKKTQ